MQDEPYYNLDPFMFCLSGLNVCQRYLKDNMKQTFIMYFKFYIFIEENSQHLPGH